jgi:hypothetical protein
VPPDLPDEAHTWFAQAAEDLNAARHLASNSDMPPRLAAFLAHLAAEKALKGTLIARKIAIRKIHDQRDITVRGGWMWLVRNGLPVFTALAGHHGWLWSPLGLIVGCGRSG